MIKVYLDWNVISGMRNNYFNDFKEIILNKEKFLLVYSTSHIGDIYASIKNKGKEEEKIINDDLCFISSITDNLCLVNNGKDVTLSTYEPNELLNDRIEQALLFEDFSIDKIFSFMEDEEPFLKELLNQIKTLLKSIPLENAFKEAFQEHESAEMIRKIFPGLENDLTMDGYFKSFGKMIENMNEKEDYKFLRDGVQKIGVKSGHFNENKNPFDIINQAYKKQNMDNFDVDKFLDTSKNAPKWFNEISNEYIKLDMHGYKADRIKVTEKEKKTFKNTTEDALHTAFASMCDYYITSDDKNYHKAKVVYEKFNINTRVFKPDEFIIYYKNYLDKHTLKEHFEIISQKIKNGEGFKERNHNDGTFFGLECITEEYILNFFNKLLIPADKNTTSAMFILSKEYPSEHYILSQKEIEGVINMLVNQLGSDINNKSDFHYGEILENENWDGMKWKTEYGIFYLYRIGPWLNLEYRVSKEN